MKRAKVAISNELMKHLDLESKDISEWSKILHAPESAKVVECQPSESGMCKFLIIEDESLPHRDGIKNYCPTLHLLHGEEYLWVWGAPFK